MIPEIVVGLAGLAAYTAMAHVVDYRILKTKHLKSKKWDLNISCGDTDGGGINADINERNVPNFVLIKDIYNLPFKDKQFENTFCSHTIEHVDDPVKFYEELRRVSKNLTILVPPVWDLAAVGYVMGHKWQFKTLKTRHDNELPEHVKLPYDWYHDKFGQETK